jgi:hypothetical protein
VLEVKTGNAGPRQVRIKRLNHAFQALFPPGALLRSEALVVVVRGRGGMKGEVHRKDLGQQGTESQVQFHRDVADKEGCTHLRSRPDFQIVSTLHMSWRIW